MTLARYEWGDESLPALVCLHGVTSHGRHFRPLAERLADRFRRRHQIEEQAQPAQLVILGDVQAERPVLEHVGRGIEEDALLLGRVAPHRHIRIRAD